MGKLTDSSHAQDVELQQSCFRGISNCLGWKGIEVPRNELKGEHLLSFLNGVPAWLSATRFREASHINLSLREPPKSASHAKFNIASEIERKRFKEIGLSKQKLKETENQVHPLPWDHLNAEQWDYFVWKAYKCKFIVVSRFHDCKELLMFWMIIHVSIFITLLLKKKKASCCPSQLFGIWSPPGTKPTVNTENYF